jgi:hypothetical protein
VSRAERAKGLAGEAEVRAIYEAAGFAVRGLEGTGDHLAMTGGQLNIGLDGAVVVTRPPLVIHSECKRQETAKVWQWWKQAEAEAPPGSLPIVAFRRNRSPWLALASLEHLARELSR